MRGSRHLDLNADMGESFGVYRLNSDAEIMPYITSANIACGWHAGDPLTMKRTVETARLHGVSIGAHPGLPDLLGFGRRHMDLEPAEAREYVIYQTSALEGIARACGMRLQHIKLHGALYNSAMRDEKLAGAIAAGIRQVHPEAIVLAMPGGALLEAATRAGLRIAREAFADRAYLVDGSLAPRDLPGAVIHDPLAAASQALTIAVDGRVQTHSGEVINVEADSICVHGDTPDVVSLIVCIRETLLAANVKIEALGGFI
jgi:UPF0271 protein